MENLKIGKLLDLEHTISKSLFERFEYPWEVLPHIKEFISNFVKTLDKNKFYMLAEDVWVAKSSNISQNAVIMGPAIIDEYAEIRFGAFIRGGVVVGKNAVVGNSTELKNCVIFDKAQTPHFNYVGDSVLGFCSHIGAGVILSNLKSDKKDIVIKYGSLQVETGMRKFGAIVSDYVEIGCNSVLNPGSIVCRNSNIYPLTMVRGVVNSGKILKNNGTLVDKI